MKPQLDLFKAAKTGPTKREKIDAFKREHSIWTYGSNKFQWDAILVGKSRELLKEYGVTDQTDPFELIASYCRLIEEADLMATGASEIGAIRELCYRNNIPCPL
jgi:hypothetical protein